MVTLGGVKGKVLLCNTKTFSVILMVFPKEDRVSDLAMNTPTFKSSV